VDRFPWNFGEPSDTSYLIFKETRDVRVKPTRLRINVVDDFYKCQVVKELVNKVALVNIIKMTIFNDG